MINSRGLSAATYVYELQRGHIIMGVFTCLAAVALSFSLGQGAGRRAERLRIGQVAMAAISGMTTGSGQSPKDSLGFYAGLSAELGDDEGNNELGNTGEVKQNDKGSDANNLSASSLLKTKQKVEIAKTEKRSLAQAIAKTKSDLAHNLPRLAAQKDKLKNTRTSKKKGAKSKRVLAKRLRLTALKGLRGGVAASHQFTIQVSAFQTLVEAQAYSTGIKRRGFTPYLVSVDIPGRGMWYRVRVGKFQDKTTAIEAKSILAQADIPAWVLRAE